MAQDQTEHRKGNCPWCGKVIVRAVVGDGWIHQKTGLAVCNPNPRDPSSPQAKPREGASPAPQPEVDAGERWRIDPYASCDIIIDDPGKPTYEAARVAQAFGDSKELRAQRAAQIVRDHRLAAVVPKLEAEIVELKGQIEKLVDECGHWRAEAEHYAERLLEDFE
jgi:hypothetical protein